MNSLLSQCHYKPNRKDTTNTSTFLRKENTRLYFVSPIGFPSSLPNMTALREGEEERTTKSEFKCLKFRSVHVKT